MKQAYKWLAKVKNIVFLECIRLEIIMTVIYCYFEREMYKVLKFHMNNFSYFEISAFHVKVPHVKASKLNKRRGRILEEIRYLIIFHLIFMHNCLLIIRNNPAFCNRPVKLTLLGICCNNCKKSQFSFSSALLDHS